MKLAGGIQTFYVYITTNKTKSVLYIGVTNNLNRRLLEHEQDAKTIKKHFTGKYNAYYLVYWEQFRYINRAIYKEKVLKGWSRKNKETLIAALNPEWKFFNDEIQEILPSSGQYNGINYSNFSVPSFIRIFSLIISVVLSS